MSKNRLYSKLVPGAWADPLADLPDHNGWVPASVYVPHNANLGPNGEPFFTLIKLEEWSHTELVPAPDGFPNEGYLAIHGPDPSLWEATFFADKEDAEDFVRKSKGFGYVSVLINTNQMIVP